MYNLDKPFEFHFELTDKCNARCIQCERNFIDKDGEIKEKPNLYLEEIRIDQFKKIFQNYQKQTHYLTFCGNYGDPLFAQDIFEITNYSLSNVLTHKGRLQINTNGGYKSKEWWAEYGSMLKSKPHLIVFAIDGLADTHHLYRVNTRFDRVIENAKSFIDAGGQAGWSFIRFGHNQHQEEEIRKLAKDLGFVKFIASNTQRFRGRSKIDYKWQGQDYSIERFKPSISKNYTAIETNSKLHKNQERYSKNQEKVRMENIRQIKCFTEAKNEIYIDAKGYVYPCCWIGSYEYEKMTGLGDSWNPQIDGRTFISSWDKDFREILKEDWFEYQLPESWEKDPCHICTRHCGKNVIKTIRQTQSI